LRRLAFVLVVAASLAAAPAWAQDPEPRIAEGVTIARVPVGGMTEAEAHTVVQAAFDRKIPFKFRQRRWEVKPDTLGAFANVDIAVGQALMAAPGTAVPLHVNLDAAEIRRYVAHLDRVFTRPALDSQLSLRRLRPFLSKPRYGFIVRKTRMKDALTRALVRTERTVIPLNVVVLTPRVTRTNYGPIIVIRRGSRRLYLYRNMNFVRRFRIAVGMPAYPTPLGRYRVVTKERHPTWDPPNSPWAAGLGPVPPGPGNPLGTRWIGTSAPGIGIHGTPQPWTVGTAASHGCIRMYMNQVEWLFERVRVGSPVFIVRQ
jgi:lipoprotein-anchoring transpeptidase ErfK/SrfK